MSLLTTLSFITRHPLNRGRKVASLVRFVNWQIGSRLSPGGVVYEWVNGCKILVKAGETGLTGNIYTGLHEFHDMAFLLHFLRPNDLFVDVGANLGSYTILACAAIGARGMAFEPVPRTYERLVENIRLNQIETRAICVNKGLGSEEGMIEFTIDGDTTNHVLAAQEQSEKKLAVEVTTLDSVLKGDCPLMIKIDVEGYESQVLQGGRETINNEQLCAVVMELNESGSRYGVDDSHLLELMIRSGFRPYSYDPFSRALAGLEGKDTGSGNTLFIRNKALVEERLRGAPAVMVNGRRF